MVTARDQADIVTFVGKNRAENAADGARTIDTDRHHQSSAKGLGVRSLISPSPMAGVGL